jgi:3-carboxy-cis,cis-muconate cycloisomerase
MSLLDQLLGSQPVLEIFSDKARVQRMLDFEAALAMAESRLGVIPTAAGPAIVSQCMAESIDFQELAKAAVDAGNLAIPLVKQLAALVEHHSPEAAPYVHWGATSQDVIDTGLMLQSRDAISLMVGDLDRLCSLLAELADRHRNTPMVARTWMQHAIPTVFGFKVAGWLDGLLRSRVRLIGLHNQAALQFGGAAGTLAALGTSGLAVAQGIASELKLVLPEIPWHTQRDRIAELATALAALTASLGKIARDIALQSQTEVGELSEPAKAGRGGSSTMPHKRNPVNAAVILAGAEQTPFLAGTVLAAMQQEHERGLGNWLAEWETVPKLFRLSSSALARMLVIMEGLEVHPDRMLQNLELTNGLIYSEAASMALAERLGKKEAHHLMEELSRKAIAEKKHLADVMRDEPRVTQHLDGAALDRVFDPKAYRGEAARFIDRVLAKHNTIVKAVATAKS